MGNEHEDREGEQRVLDEISKLSSKIERLERELSRLVDAAVDASVARIEESVNLAFWISQRTLLPNLKGWAISSDLAMFLVREISTRNYDLVIEFGSGESTILLADALKVFQKATAKRRPRLVSFEHLPVHGRKTRQKLRAAGLLDVADVVDARLIAFGDGYFYDCSATLASLSTGTEGSDKSILVLVDGPPGKTCREARYPALPVVVDAFPGRKLCVVMDDADRADEKAILVRWERELNQRGIAYVRKNLRFEKGASVIRIRSKREGL